MLYLFDANTLIAAKNLYYPMHRVPEFWTWMIHQGTQGNIKIPIEIYDELTDKTSKKEDRDDLSQWADQPEVTEALLLSEESVPDLVQRVTYGGYTANPTDEEIMKMGADPLLISYALTDIENRTIVTVETSKPSRQGANKHIPDVCGALGVRCIDTFKILNELDFRTDWESQQ